MSSLPWTSVIRRSARIELGVRQRAAESLSSSLISVAGDRPNELLGDEWARNGGARSAGNAAHVSCRRCG